jgi:hypothetical protein
MTADHSFRRAYRLVLLGVVIGFVLIAGLIAGFGTRPARAEGVAERWATAVSDTTRKGVGADARKRIGEHGDLSLLGRFGKRGVDHHGKTMFTALEVGKAARPSPDVARVPLKVEYREASEGTTSRSVLTLHRSGDTWRVVGVDAAIAGLRVPGDGGPAVTRAPIALYGAVLVLGIAITIGCGALIRSAEPALVPAVA